MLRKLLFPVALSTLALILSAASGLADLQQARYRQDTAAVEAAINKLQASAKSGDADAQYQLALAYSYAAEIAIEQRDKHKAESFAQQGIDAAKKAVSGNANKAEYHRILGELCGQVIPANPLMGSLKYGQCARDEVNKAIELDGKSALAYLSRGVGNYYLPAQFGGGADVALKDIDQAIALDPKLSDAYLWKGIALRKVNRNAEAHQAIEKAVQLSPDWVWAKDQLQKTPAH
jgi:tetratricopeptide (TPR) repeat protein